MIVLHVNFIALFLINFELFGFVFLKLIVFFHIIELFFLNFHVINYYFMFINFYLRIV